MKRVVRKHRLRWRNPVVEKAMIPLLFGEGLDTQRIAELLGCPESDVYNGRSYAGARLASDVREIVAEMEG